MDKQILPKWDIQTILKSFSGQDVGSLVENLSASCGDSHIEILYNKEKLLAHGRWFSPGTPASSTTKSGRHDITEILLKVAKNQNQPK